MAEYDDDRFLQLTEQLRSIIGELMEMDGNDGYTVRDEVDLILEDWE